MYDISHLSYLEFDAASGRVIVNEAGVVVPVDGGGLPDRGDEAGEVERRAFLNVPLAGTKDLNAKLACVENCEGEERGKNQQAEKDVVQQDKIKEEDMDGKQKEYVVNDR